MFIKAYQILALGCERLRACARSKDRTLRLVALGGLLVSAACAPTHSSMLRGTVAPPPLSFARTCADAPGECQAPGLDYVAALSDRDALHLLQHVNTEVNAKMASLATEQTNLRDEWLPAKSTQVGLSGDCKSYAAEKRRLLIAKGFPADELSYAVVFRADLGLHALLLARLGSGDYVLDSRQPWVRPWSDAGYTFVLYQEPGSPAEWRTALDADPTSTSTSKSMGGG